MAIPNYQDFMNIVLKICAESGRETRVQDMEPIAADMLGLSTEERQMMVKSGTNTVVYSRLHWATYYMFAAGLLSRPRRGYYMINDLGLAALKSGVTINNDFLMRYPSFVDFMNRANMLPMSKKKGTKKQVLSCAEEQDPEERVVSAINELNVVLEEDILNALKVLEPKRFERVVVDLMEAMDYGAGTVTQYVCDGGIDGIINEDELGLSKIYLQAKRYNDGKVNEKEMRDFVGALATNNVVKGVFITTSCFSDKAQTTAKNAHGHVIRLIDGMELAKLMRMHNLGARRKKNYDIKEFDSSYFE